MMIRGRTVYNSRGVASGYQAAGADPDAMQVDAFGKGKQKGKHKGRNKGKSKDKSKLGVKGTIGKNQKGAGKFNGYCNGCKKWGHKQAQCYTTGPAAAQVDAAAQAEGPSAATGPGSKGASAGGVSQVKTHMSPHGSWNLR